MNSITLRSDFDVSLVQHMGNDEMLCKAARVSTLGAASIDSEEAAGLIRFLMSNRHGTPFEHAAFTFLINAPIFVWREFMRHRIGISYNEQSGRYMELSNVFYIPDRDRNLIQQGKPGHYEFVPGSDTDYRTAYDSLEAAYAVAWNEYQHMLYCGIAKEVARMCLPVSIYSAAYVTMNPRSLLNFLTLRTKYETSLFPSFPMKEINTVADQMEDIFAELFPITHAAFNQARRVAP
jgi:thymidylate synthase (FAD)